MVSTFFKVPLRACAKQNLKDLEHCVKYSSKSNWALDHICHYNVIGLHFHPNPSSRLKVPMVIKSSFFFYERGESTPVIVSVC